MPQWELPESSYSYEISCITINAHPKRIKVVGIFFFMENAHQFEHFPKGCMGTKLGKQPVTHG